MEQVKFDLLSKELCFEPLITKKKPKIIKKNGKKEEYDFGKIVSAITKSADRVNHKLTEEELNDIEVFVENELDNITADIQVLNMHYIVECALEKIVPEVAKSYKDYRNYKTDFVSMMDKIFTECRDIQYLGDKDNANTDSALISTKRSLILKKLSKEIYQKFNLSKQEVRDIEDGYYYIHDIGDRIFTSNCCLFDIGNVLKGGFEMANMTYTEPSNIRSGMAIMSDIALSAAAQQYGGFSMCEIDTVLEPYAIKSYNKYITEYHELSKEFDSQLTSEQLEIKADEYAMRKIERDVEQGFQEWEYKFNTLSSSRGDYPFVTITLGLNKSKFGKVINKTCFRVRAGGQGAEGHKRPVLFPKIVFLYDKNLHGDGKELQDVFDSAIECSSKAIYPDYLSLTGDGYVSDIYKQYGKVISPMGCRAFLSPYWEKGGQEKLDDSDTPIFISRWNGGAISVNLPMIYMKSVEEKRDFYEVYDEYLERIRNIHKRTREYLSHMKASENPLAFTQGGFLGGNLQPNEEIGDLVDSTTFSFGFTALNELQYLYNGKSIYEDGDFAYEALKHLNEFAEKAKKEDKIMYAIYATPAESLCYTQVNQYNKKYPEVGPVGKKSYFTNSFHCAVWEDITPIEKQDSEYRFFHISNGGHIQYCRYPNGKNIDAIKQLVTRAMDMGYYEGVNIEKNYCEDCGNEFEDGVLECPHCGSKNITQINRVCGYISYSKVNGSTRMNNGKLEEIKDRVSM